MKKGKFLGEIRIPFYFCRLQCSNTSVKCSNRPLQCAHTRFRIAPAMAVTGKVEQGPHLPPSASKSSTIAMVCSRAP
jgi:hypothetical protein